MKGELFMKKKIEFKKLANAKWLGYGAAAIAAIVAFCSTLQERQKEKEFDDLVDRVTKLENK